MPVTVRSLASAEPWFAAASSGAEGFDWSDRLEIEFRSVLTLDQAGPMLAAVGKK